MTQPLQPNLVGLPYAPAEAVLDHWQSQQVHAAICSATDFYKSNDIVLTFGKAYRQWIQSTVLNQVRGLELFAQCDFAQGTTESFDKFYLRHHTRRFRCFKGEYLYHSLAWQSQNMSWTWLDQEPLAVGDAVVISLPFADLGSAHPQYTAELLNQCAELDIPVLLDCAFFGICADIDFDFCHPAITDICFSLSKTFPVSKLRIGIRFSKSANDTLAVYNRTAYVNHFGAAVGVELLKVHGPDTIYDRWRSVQLDFCSTLDLVPSSTVIFGIDHNHGYDNYNRGMQHTNRLCFSRYFQQGKLAP